MFAQADVAELVDAQVSEACSRERVEVRFFSSAPFHKCFVYNIYNATPRDKGYSMALLFWIFERFG